MSVEQEHVMFIKLLKSEYKNLPPAKQAFGPSPTLEQMLAAVEENCPLYKDVIRNFRDQTDALVRGFCADNRDQIAKQFQQQTVKTELDVGVLSRIKNELEDASGKLEAGKEAMQSDKDREFQRVKETISKLEDLNQKFDEELQKLQNVK